MEGDVNQNCHMVKLKARQNPLFSSIDECHCQCWNANFTHLQKGHWLQYGIKIVYIVKCTP